MHWRSGDCQGLRMTRRGWVVFGAVGGAGGFALAGGAAVWITGTISRYWPQWLLGSAMTGLVVGGLVGSRAPRTTRLSRVVFGAICGAAAGATVLGSLFLFAEVTSDDPTSGLAAFLTGVAVGGIAGLLLGGLAGYATSRSDT